MKQCAYCQKLRSWTPKSVKTAGLHPNRIGLGFRPFVEVNVGMAGPFSVRHGKTRASIKVYAVLFVCSAMRAINIEVCEDASARSCIFSFQRHTARYGNPTIVYTDNSTNFRGTERAVREQMILWKEMEPNWARRWPRIEWRFSPPYHLELSSRVDGKSVQNSPETIDGKFAKTVTKRRVRNTLCSGGKLHEQETLKFS